MNPLPDQHQDPMDLWQRLFYDNMEKYKDSDVLDDLDGFRPGGDHPIDLKDELDDGKYRVIHRLGTGTFSAVWLCRELESKIPTYVAIKVVQAEHSDHSKSRDLHLTDMADGTMGPLESYSLCLPLTHFESESPNGKHRCLVYPVRGPESSHAQSIFRNRDAAADRLRGICIYAINGLNEMHRANICHGDFQPTNILLGLKSLDGLEEEEVYHRLGGLPRTEPLKMREDSRPMPDMPHAPRELVHPIYHDQIPQDMVEERTWVNDFDSSFNVSDPSTWSGWEPPIEYSPPEMILDGAPSSKAADLWGLGCTLYEIRLGEKLFGACQWTEDDTMEADKYEYLAEIQKVIGKHPTLALEDLFRKLSVVDSEEKEGGPQSSPRSNIGDLPGDYVVVDKATTATDDEKQQETQSPEEVDEHERARQLIQERLARVHHCDKSLCKTHDQRYQLISEPEAVAFADLLEKLLRYRPEDRVAVQDLFQHEWFQTDHWLGPWEQPGVWEADVEGHEEAYEKGRKDGFEQGRKEGLKKGYEEGFEDGMEKGLIEGYDEGSDAITAQIVENSPW